MKPRMPTLRMAAIAALGVSGLTACSGSGGNDKPVRVTAVQSVASAPSTPSSAPKASTPVTDDAALALLAEASTKSIEGKTAKLSFSMTGSAAGQPITMSGDGAFNFETSDMQMTMDMSSMLGALGSTGPPGLSGDDFRIELRMKNATMYMHMPFLAKMAGGGAGLDIKPWLSVSLDQISEMAGLGASFSELQGNSDPTEFLATLTSTSDDVTKVGVDDIRGTSSTHYRGTLDLAKTGRQIPAELRAKIEARTGKDLSETYAELVKKYGVERIPFDAWVDGDGRVRRMAMAINTSAMPGAADGSDTSGSITISYDLFDYGAAVDIQAPPADQVSDYTTLMALAGAASPTLAEPTDTVS